MSDLSEVSKLVEEQGKLLHDLRKSTEEKSSKTDAERKAAEAKMGEDILALGKQIKEANDATARQLTEIEKKAGRPAAGKEGDSEEDALHRKAFGGYLRRGVEFDRDIERKSLATTSGPDGGFGVPKVIDSMIDKLAVNISPIRSIARVQKISTQDFHKLIDVRGVNSGWVGETAARTSTNTSQFADIVPPMGELYANPQATQVMLDDTFFDAESWLAEEVATEFARAEGAAFVNGTGVAQPRGFLTYTNVATGDATRAFGSIEFAGTGASGAFKTLTSTVNPADDLFTLVSKLKKAYRDGASWITNKAVLFTIMGFKDYQGRYVFNPTTAPGVEDTILGYPVVEAEDMPALAANSYSLAFGNFDLAYLIVDRVGTRVIRDPFSNKPYVGFYTTKRLGGAVTNSEALKLLKFI